MSIFQIIFGVFAILLLVGGVMGYVKSNSKPSLIMGVISAVVVAVGVCVLSKNQYVGFLVISVMSALLTITFLIRYLKTKKLMPAGMLLVLSGVASGLSIYQLFLI